MNRHLINAKEAAELSRPNYADSSIINACIEEAEQLDIKAALGDSLFLRLLNSDSDLGILMEGGEYERCGERRVFPGLKKTLAYYIYARVVKNGSSVQTRFAFVNKQDDHSNTSDFKDRMQAYNDAFSIADRYLKQCLDYILANKELFPDYRGHGRIKNNRVVTRIIGD